MNETTITIGAILQLDGQTLQLDKKLTLPPGRVMVTVQPTKARSGPTMLDALDRIHQLQQQRGQGTMTQGEMKAEARQLRDDDNEYEERWKQIWSQTEAGAERMENP